MECEWPVNSTWTSQASTVDHSQLPNGFLHGGHWLGLQFLCDYKSGYPLQITILSTGAGRDFYGIGWQQTGITESWCMSAIGSLNTAPLQKLSKVINMDASLENLLWEIGKQNHDVSHTCMQRYITQWSFSSNLVSTHRTESYFNHAQIAINQNIFRYFWFLGFSVLLDRCQQSRPQDSSSDLGNLCDGWLLAAWATSK